MEVFMKRTPIIVDLAYVLTAFLLSGGIAIVAVFLTDEVASETIHYYLQHNTAQPYILPLEKPGRVPAVEPGPYYD
jgi:hypothetical protein